MEYVYQCVAILYGPILLGFHIITASFCCTIPPKTWKSKCGHCSNNVLKTLLFLWSSCPCGTQQVPPHTVMQMLHYDWIKLHVHPVVTPKIQPLLTSECAGGMLPPTGRTQLSNSLNLNLSLSPSHRPAM